MATNAITYEKQVKQLVERHMQIKRNGRLLFAGWYNRGNRRGDINLFEIYEDFPDPGLGKLETFMFPSSADFPMKGRLRLTVTSPSELREAAARGDDTLAAIMHAADREVVYPENGDWERLMEELKQ